MKKWITMLLALVLAASMLTGFAAVAWADEEPAEAEAAETEEPAEEEDAGEEGYEGLDRIGEETEEGYKIKLTNATGTNIKGLNIQKTTDDSWVWSDELLTEGDVFEDGETALFCYTPDEEDEQEDWQSTYNIQIVFSDWTVGYLHEVLLSDIEDEAEIQRAANSLPYLVYVSHSSEEEINTSELEQAAFEGELAAGFWDSVINAGSSSSGGGSSSGGSSSGGSGGGSSTPVGASGGCVGPGAEYNP